MTDASKAAKTEEKPFEVLLVEDNPSDAELTVMAFADAHIQAHLTVVRDGDSAIKMLKKVGRFEGAGEPDLVLLDLNLPRRNGHEVLEEVRRTPSLAHIPIAILSTSDGEADFKKSYALGADCHLVKPADYEALILLVRGVGRLWLALSDKVKHIAAAAADSDLTTAASTLLSAQEGGARPYIKVLIVEDNSSDVLLLEHLLAASTDYRFEISRASRLQEAVAAAQTTTFDVVLLDLGLPDSQGLRTFECFQEACPNLPVVVQSGSDTGPQALQAVRLGAQDYLPKQDVESYSLSRALVHAIERKSAATERLLLIGRERLARVEAEQAVFARDEFLSIASHEFRTPITALNLQVERLQRASEAPEGGALAERVAKVTHRMHLQIERLDRLVGNLLDVSRAGSSLKLDVREMSLTHLVESTLVGMQGQIEASRSKVEFVAQSEARGSWDAFRLEQVVVNLISNALKYGGGGPIRIDITESADEACLLVCDQGIGIASEDFGRIFSRFERAADTSAFEGLGLGLFITRQIVEAHKGTISVTSEVGNGSVFKVVLPLHTAQAA